MPPQPVPTSSTGALSPPIASKLAAPKSGDSMDEERARSVAYEYLCHLEEAKNWVGACLHDDDEEELPPTTQLEEALRNGVYLAKLAHFFAPKTVSKKRIFDPDQSRYREGGLHFRHTDNINHFLQGCKAVGLPEVVLHNECCCFMGEIEICQRLFSDLPPRDDGHLRPEEHAPRHLLHPRPQPLPLQAGDRTADTGRPPCS